MPVHTVDDASLDDRVGAQRHLGRAAWAWRNPLPYHWPHTRVRCRRSCQRRGRDAFVWLPMAWKDDATMPNPAKGLPAGTPAPDFTLPVAGGGQAHLGDLRGRWVIVFFFRGTW